jgi:hypothetical protein
MRHVNFWLSDVRVLGENMWAVNKQREAVSDANRRKNWRIGSGKDHTKYWSLFKVQWKKKGKEELHSFCQNTKRDRGESYFERYYRNGSSPWFREIKTNRHAFASINRMRAGHSSLKASLNRFNSVSSAECKGGDGLQTEEHIFWDCKLWRRGRIPPPWPCES